MPGAGKEELEKLSQEIEDDQIEDEVDSAVQEKTGTLDNQVDTEEDGEPESETKTETEEKNEEEGEETDKVPDLQVRGNTLEASEGNVSVNIDEDLKNGETSDTSGMQMTEEEQDAAKDVSGEKSSIFDTQTGVTKALGDFTPDFNQQESPEKEESDTQDSKNNIFDQETGAKEAKPLSKGKKFLFSAILGFKKATKGIGNFFKKKLPKAFKSGAKVAKKVMKYTPLAPVVHIIDKVSEYREKTRPQRELKAKQKAEAKAEAKLKKQEQYLLDQDEKRHKAEEAERLKQEEKELKKKAKAAKWELKKKNNTWDYRTVKFFKGIWGGIKTGASWIGNKIKNSKPGIIAATLAAKTAKVVKGVVKDVKQVAGAVIGKVTAAIDQAKDEYDEYSFEDRMETITAEENKKKEKGEDVPEEDYRTRYLALTEELKGKLASIRKNITRREEIEETLAEMEDHTVLALPGKEEIDADEWRNEVSDIGAGSDLANEIIEKISEGASKFATEKLNPYIDAIASFAKMGSEIGRAEKFRQRKVLMEAIAATSKDELMKRVSRYAKSNAELKQMEAGFDAAIEGLNGVEAVGTGTGIAPVATGASVVKNIVKGVKFIATSKKTRAGVKNGIKDMLGGKEGYYALKAKYKMHAPEMRRAVRDALGVATSEDAVTADKWELSHLMSQRAKSGVMDKETERMVAEAGGNSEKHFDALMGAGESVKRRNADRRKRMTA